MAIVTTNEQHYFDIADAIRNKGVSGRFTSSQMAAAIESIEAGGANLVWRGTWNSTTQYAKNDLVAWEGSFFVATETTIGAIPDVDSGWELFAAVIDNNLQSENIKKNVSILGFSGSYDGAERSAWYRPPDWPDYDAMNHGTEYACYLTYDTQIPLCEDYKYAAFSIRYWGSSIVKVDRGHVSNNAFIIDADNIGHQLGTSEHWEVVEPLPAGQRFPVYRITYTGSNKSAYNAYPNSAKYILHGVEIQSGVQPLVEVYAVNGGARGEVGGNLTSVWTEAITITNCKSRMLESMSENYYVPKNVRIIGSQNQCCKFNNARGIHSVEFINSTFKKYGDMDYSIFRTSSLVNLNFTGSTFELTSLNFWFDGASNINSLDISMWDLINCTNFGNAFTGMTNLVELFLPTMPVQSFSINGSSKLSNESLLRIGNALTAGTATLALHSMPKAKLSSIAGTVADGVFAESEDGDISLLSFINNVKGWTVA